MYEVNFCRTGIWDLKLLFNIFKPLNFDSSSNNPFLHNKSGGCWPVAAAPVGAYSLAFVRQHSFAFRHERPKPSSLRKKRNDSVCFAAKIACNFADLLQKCRQIVSFSMFM
jgi:hypothetical protein